MPRKLHAHQIDIKYTILNLLIFRTHKNRTIRWTKCQIEIKYTILNLLTSSDLQNRINYTF